MKYRNIIFVAVFALWSFVTLSCQTFNSEADSIDTIYLRDFDTVGIEKALNEWRMDSLGCLNLRSRGMANYIVEKFELKSKTYKEVVAVLGKPNEEYTRKGLLDDGDEEFLYLDYYFAIRCKDGRPLKLRLGYCWLSICIHPETRKVLSVSTPCS